MCVETLMLIVRLMGYVTEFLSGGDVIRWGVLVL